MKLIWVFKTFEALTPGELYAALKLRQEIFVVEQHCAYQDADGKDINCHHLLGFDTAGTIACYARIVMPGISYPEISIGRVATSSSHRGKGIGKLLLTETLFRIEKLYGKVPVRIGAQGYLVKFYGSFGFEIAEPEGYFEDGILHFIMVRKTAEH